MDLVRVLMQVQMPPFGPLGSIESAGISDCYLFIYVHVLLIIHAVLAALKGPSVVYLSPCYVPAKSS